MANIIRDNTNINSFLAAIMILFSLLAIFLGNLMPTYVGITIGSLIIMIYSFSIIRNQNEVFTDISTLVFISLIVLWFIISLIMTNFNTYTMSYFNEFAFFGFFGLLIGNKQVKTESVIKYISIIGLILLPIIAMIIRETVANTNGSYMLKMPTSYALMPVGIAGILGLLFYRKKLPLISKLGCLISLGYLVIILIGGTRGIYVVLAFFFWILIINIYRLRNKDITPRTRRVSAIIVFLGLFGFIFLLVFSVDIILWVSRITKRLGLNITIIQKSVSLIDSTDDFTNGRIYLYNVALKGILKSPIWGYGIGAYAIETFTYPHNLLLQVFYEGGILLAAIIITPLAWSFVLFFKYKINKDLFIYIILLMSISIPKLMISSYLWQDASFWMLIGCLFMMRDKGDGHNMKLERIMEEK